MQGLWLRKLGLIAVVTGIGALAGCASQAPPPPPKPAPAPAPRIIVPPVPAIIKPHPAPIKKTAPLRYVVKKGDTLWGISSRFLRDPWYWPTIWYENPYIKDPHLIYPGDVITLSRSGNHPVLSIYRAGTLVATTSAPLRTRMLKPRIERIPLGEAIPTLPYDDIAALLSKPRVMTAKRYQAAPYVLRPTERLLAAAPTGIYARGIPAAEDRPGTSFAIVKKNQPLYDPKTHELLGYEVIYLARATITTGGDPSTLQLDSSMQEVSPGNRLVRIETGIIPSRFPLLPPSVPVAGEIISVIGGMNEVGQYQTVVLDRGTQNGLKIGTTLVVYTAGKRVFDSYAHGNLAHEIKLPEQRIGELVIFRAYPRVSFALVMRATQPIRVNDPVRNP